MCSTLTSGTAPLSGQLTRRRALLLATQPAGTKTLTYRLCDEATTSEEGTPQDATCLTLTLLTTFESFASTGTKPSGHPKSSACQTWNLRT